MIRTIVVFLIAFLAIASTADAQGGDCRGLTYFRGTFSITIARPPNDAFALFDAKGESRWDPTWSPKFLHGDAYDAGSVFQTNHDGHTTTWLVDSYDSQNKRVSYVVLPSDGSIENISVTLVPNGNGSRADVAYERTALNDAGKREVGDFCTTFSHRQGDWQAAMDAAK
ncbi:MAG TPA: hypothetical protein VK760_06595 [Candidatus Acidoferrales bacterium]|jgi:hypothetical protein|nr:hypothetical protein [Candidatus Acidoferrales bacterium]